MPTLPLARLVALLEPFTGTSKLAPSTYERLSAYLDLLVRWNGRTNLTAIREPEEIVERHFGESLFTGLQIAAGLPGAQTLLDFGSGAGFPGILIQLAVPALTVTLAESQGKKAAFLREAVRVLELPTSLWPRRVDQLPADQRFDLVALRAVDKMDEAIAEARTRLGLGGRLVILGGAALAQNFPGADVLDVPASLHRRLILAV